MGATLAKAVLGPKWAHLPHRAARLFAYMAVTAKDQDQPPRYYGGRDALVECLYGEVSSDPRRREVQYREVREALKAIEKAGGIGSRTKGRKGVTPAAYELIVHPTLEGSETPPIGNGLEVSQAPPINPELEGDLRGIGGVSTSDWRGLSVGLEVSQAPPQEQVGTMKEQGGASAPSRAGGAPPTHMRAEAREHEANTRGDADAPHAFAKFWEIYPRRKDRGRALKAFKSALKKTDADTILAAAEAFAATQVDVNERWIPYPAKWLEGERWADAPDKPAAAGSNSHRAQNKEPATTDYKTEQDVTQWRAEPEPCTYGEYGGCRGSDYGYLSTEGHDPDCEAVKDRQLWSPEITGSPTGHQFLKFWGIWSLTYPGEEFTVAWVFFKEAFEMVGPVLIRAAEAYVADKAWADKSQSLMRPSYWLSEGTWRDFVPSRTDR